MYGDNAWPEAAGIEAFIEERRRPQRVVVAVYGFWTAAGFLLLAGVLYPVAGITGSGVALSLPWWIVLVAAGAGAGWCVVVAEASRKGRRWALTSARSTGVGLIVAGGGFAALANPKATAMSAFGWGYTLLVLVAVLAGAGCLVCLMGRVVSEYFDPPTQPAPPLNRTSLPMTGNEADWVPPQQHAPGAPHGDGRQPQRYR
ncbi:MAG TPA: hypothetical protein H9881_13980 [Candidatus Stackebrandtia excrementipullorum]|nr:hypothetical protein [Candidatus Stackebrandtia excrementipullorum]